LVTLGGRKFIWKICWGCSSLALTDVYLSTVSDRLNAVMKQVTIIATVFCH
jgi:hypothetical protein